MFTRLRYLAEYLPFYLVTSLLSLLPFKAAVRLGEFLGTLAYILDFRHRRTAEDNISAAMHLNRHDAALMSRRVFENLGRTFVEFLHLERFDGWLREHTTVEGMEHYIEAKETGKGILFLSAHLGNWETLGVVHTGGTGDKMNVIYRRTKNPYVNDFIDSLRGRRGFHMISHRNSVREILAALKNTESVGILLDQVPRPKESVLLEFMSRPAQTNAGLALIALKTGAPVVPIFFVRHDDGYRFVYEKPIFTTRTGDFENDVRAATEQFNGVIERYIRRYPEQWFWVHDRWKISRRIKNKMGIKE